MSIGTYAELQTAVSNWMHRSDLATFIPDLILMGEKWIFRNARTRDMETALNVTISSGIASVPADFVALKSARISGSPNVALRVRPASWIYSQYPNRSNGSIPSFIAVEGSTFIFGPSAGGYTVLGTYYARLASVQSSANALFVANPDLYLFATLCEAEPFLKNDKRMPLWMAKRDQILNDVNSEDKESRQGDAMEVAVG
jgi:hypothetical protein